MAGFIKNNRILVIVLGLLCIALIGGVLLGKGFYKQASYESITSPYNAEELLEYKTPYVGNNVKVTNIINNLIYGDIVKGISLQTKSEPYGITINYDSNYSKTDIKLANQELYNNAAIIFALVDNVEKIDFNNVGAERPEIYRYNRAVIQKDYSDDLRKYSKDIETFKAFLQSLIFKVNVFPDKYQLAMSSTPGLQLKVIYYGNQKIERVQFSADNGTLFTWDKSTSALSKRQQTIELPLGEDAYWSPIMLNKEDSVDKDTKITITLLGNENKVLGKKQIIIANEDSYIYKVKPDMGILIDGSAAVQK